MRCEITLGWRNGDDDMKLSREKTPEEVWGPSGPRNVLQAIQVLDQTYADIRAAMIATLPSDAQRSVAVVALVTAEQAQRMAERKA